MPKILKKKKPELEAGEIEDDDMVITDEWIDHVDETLEQKSIELSQS